MLNLYVLNETFTNGLSYSLVSIIEIFSILCGVSVIISKNPIVSVLFLIGLFLNIAGYLMMLGINFIGLSYLLVYVGAVSILFLFILMLINVRISELVTDTNNSIPLALIIGILFNITLYKLLPTNVIAGNSILTYHIFNGLQEKTVNSLSKMTYSTDNNNLSFVTSQTWDGALAETSHITSIGNVIYTSYPIWLILTSIILLLAMVGAIIITIKQIKLNKPAFLCFCPFNASPVSRMLHDVILNPEHVQQGMFYIIPAAPVLYTFARAHFYFLPFIATLVASLYTLDFITWNLDELFQLITKLLQLQVGANNIRNFLSSIDTSSMNREAVRGIEDRLSEAEDLSNETALLLANFNQYIRDNLQ